MDRVSYDLMLQEFNSYIEGIPDGEDLLLFAAVDLKGKFIDLYGDSEE